MDRIFHPIVLGLAALALAGAACAQPWPAKPIRIIVPYPPGGTSDILARSLAPRLQETFGQAVVVENKPGATGNVGADFVAKSPPDGYNVLFTVSSFRRCSVRSAASCRTSNPAS